MVLALTLTAVPCVALAQGDSPAIKYNNDVAKATKDLEAVGKAFGDKIQQNQGNNPALKAAFYDVVKKAEGIFQDARRLTPPATPEGKAMHQEFQKYLDVEEEIVRIEFAVLIRDFMDNDMAGVQKTVQRVTRMENERVAALKGAQQTFAKANNIKLQ